MSHRFAILGPLLLALASCAAQGAPSCPEMGWESAEDLALARRCLERGDHVHAAAAARAAIEAWPENEAAIEFLTALNQESRRSEPWRCRWSMDSFLLKVIHHIASGEMYSRLGLDRIAAVEFEEAEFWIRHCPCEATAMSVLAARLARSTESAARK